ncbi:MAG: hypothetical protein EOP46_11690 [Sphingobacteriaceae bacterium]|nr:MAG: hypothetical protein EOP46_11690 [Sphingobacteriaceae bacterium]
MANKLLLLFCLIIPSATLKAQTYADQQRQYRSYQAQHLATVRAYSVSASSYSAPAYRSSGTAGSSGSGSTNRGSTNNSGGGTVRATSNSNWSAYIRSDIKPWTNDDYDDYSKRNTSWKPEPPPPAPKEAGYYTGSTSSSCQGDCSETLVAKNKSFTYTGNTLNGVPNGTGIIKWDVGTYTGEVKDGRPNGEGSTTWNNGLYHKGTYSDGQFNGRGTMDYGDGSIFTGLFEKGLPVKGFQRFPSGMTYDGHFLNGEFHGLGELKFGTNNLYNGEFKNGNFEGKGVLEVGKTTVTGDFRNNKAYYGTIRWEKTGEFTGFFHQTIVNIIPKIGEQRDPNYTYSGSFDENGKRSGYGYYVEPNGTKTEGQWIKGELSGVGMRTYANGQIIKGRVDYKGVKMLGAANHEGNWYPAHLDLQNTIKFLDGEAATECSAALIAAEDYIIAGRKAYNDLMSAAQ